MTDIYCYISTIVVSGWALVKWLGDVVVGMELWLVFVAETALVLMIPTPSVAKVVGLTIAYG
jgi:hypothetical protein